jgi:alpha-galactosidase/6-phospho-beta-glucosidase family protein
LNHLCWLLDIRSEGIDLYPQLKELVAARCGDRHAPSSRQEGVHAAVSADLLRTFGRYPAPGDRHVAEFFSNYLRQGLSGDLAWGLQGGQDMTREYIAEKDKLWDDLRAQASGEQPVQVRGNQEAERLVAIAEALLAGRDHLELAVNLPNDGKIPNLPPTAIVEVPALIGAAGIIGLAVGRLPDAIAAVLTARVHQQEITVQAAVSGDRELALQALVLDPLVADSGIARSILDDAIADAPLTLQRYAS